MKIQNHNSKQISGVDFSALVSGACVMDLNRLRSQLSVDDDGDEFDLYCVVKFAVKDYQEALGILESAPDDTASKYSTKSTTSTAFMMTVDSSSFSVC